MLEYKIVTAMENLPIYRIEMANDTPFPYHFSIWIPTTPPPLGIAMWNVLTKRWTIIFVLKYVKTCSKNNNKKMTSYSFYISVWIYKMNISIFIEAAHQPRFLVRAENQAKWIARWSTVNSFFSVTERLGS